VPSVHYPSLENMGHLTNANMGHLTNVRAG
jgi:hypothetical protein